MYGATMGTLNVIMNNGASSTKLWSRSGNQGPNWQLWQVSVPASANYTIMFEGIVGNGFTSDMAIDDVSVTAGSCTLPGEKSLT